jgi:Fur family ferric uptake transcriptional regulator/Fur family peroxide stress response transcriptional regulator
MSTDDVGTVLRRYDLRVTPQRRAILRAFRGTQDEHLSVEEVLSRASATVPDIGRGTVYATLAEFSELGVLASTGSPEPMRYETNVEPHDHFRCRLCLRLFDVDHGGQALRDLPLAGYSIESVSVQLEGVCADCQAYERGLRDGTAEILRTTTISPKVLDRLACRRVNSPIGEIALAATGNGIVRIAFDDHADFAAINKRASGRRGPGLARPRLTDLGTALTGYLGGSRAAFLDVIDWDGVSDEHSQLLTAVQQIPYATMLSYNEISGGMDAYDVGHLIGTNPWPMLIPCHRMCRGSHHLEQYVGGLERLHFLNALEAG